MTAAPKKESRRGRILFELLDVALLDLLHEALTLEDVPTEIGGQQAKNGEKLIMGAFLKRDGFARESGETPLEHKAASLGGELTGARVTAGCATQRPLFCLSCAYYKR